MNHSEHEETITSINIAPLVDIILVLLIIFMATAPLVHRRAINVNVPKAAQTEQKATATLNLVMNEKKELFLGEKRIVPSELGFQLGAMVRSDPFLHVSVLADQTIPYGEVVSVLDIVRGSGVKKVALEVRSKKVK
ncbi:MAG: biopolymer transporter ExbD [Elusimicrobia bacterium]|nr:biopolymer transporter ExbD [Elusimicrobiota bacterium]